MDFIIRLEHFLPNNYIHPSFITLNILKYLTALTVFSLPQVVVKTRTEYQTEKKRLKVPKVEEFTISFTDGVSERLKVRFKTQINKRISLVHKYMIHMMCYAYKELQANTLNNWQ